MTFHIVGLLCPIENIDAANEAAFQLSQVEADRQTFSPDAVLARDGELWAYAHGPLSVESFAQLPALSDMLGGVYFETVGDFWERVEALGFEVVGLNDIQEF